MSSKVAVIAIGGNSLIKDKQHQTVPDQYEAAGETSWHIANLIKEGWDASDRPWKWAAGRLYLAALRIIPARTPRGSPGCLRGPIPRARLVRHPAESL